MNQGLINPGNQTHQLYYPLDHLKIPENNQCEEDKYFIDQTIPGIQPEKYSCIESRIIRTDSRTFTYKKGSIFKWSVIIFLFIIPSSVAIITLFTIDKFELNDLIGYFFGLFLPFSSGICMGCCIDTGMDLILEPKSIKLIKKNMYIKKKTIYNFGELEKAEIWYYYDSEPNAYNHNFNLYFVRISGKKELFHTISSDRGNVELTGIKYFIDLINEHIQKNMR